MTNIILIFFVAISLKVWPTKEAFVQVVYFVTQYSDDSIMEGDDKMPVSFCSLSAIGIFQQLLQYILLSKLSSAK